jgi:hypothetical protein
MMREIDIQIGNLVKGGCGPWMRIKVFSRL